MPSALPRPAVAARGGAVRRCRDLRELAVLFEPAVNIALLERGLSTTLDDDARALAELLRQRSRLMAVEPTACGRSALLDEFRTTPCFAEDLSRCIELFADLTEARLVGVRIAHLTAAMCPRLHVDRVTLRMVVTYLGPGTEYVDGAAFDRSLLGAGAADDQPAPGTAQVERARAGDIVLLKGEAWPDNAGFGAIHRSPTTSPEAPRLVLTLDAL